MYVHFLTFIIEEIFHQFSIYNIFYVSTEETFFIKGPSQWNNSDPKQLRIYGAQSQSDRVLLSITSITRTFFSTIFLNFLNFLVRVVSSRWPFIKNVSFVETRNKCYIYSKLVNNPFKQWCGSESESESGSAESVFSRLSGSESESEI